MAEYRSGVKYKDHRGDTHQMWRVAKFCDRHPENTKDSAPSVDVMNTWDNFLKLALAHIPDVKVGYIFNDEHRVAVFTDDCMFNMGELMLGYDDHNVPMYHITSHSVENRRICPVNRRWEYRIV